MLTILKQISKFLGSHTSLVVIMAAVVAGLSPDMFAWVQQGQRPNVILGIIMLTMGCTLSTDDFKMLLRRPTDILLGTLAQFTVMPLVAYGLSHLFGLNPFLSAGIILVGCCPGGVSSYNEVKYAYYWGSRLVKNAAEDFEYARKLVSSRGLKMDDYQRYSQLQQLAGRLSNIHRAFSGNLERKRRAMETSKAVQGATQGLRQIMR